MRVLWLSLLPVSLVQMVSALLGCQRGKTDLTMPHTFLRGHCQDCGVLEDLLPGLRSSPLDREPRPHHADPQHSGWMPHCPLCQELEAFVKMYYADALNTTGGRFP